MTSSWPAGRFADLEDGGRALAAVVGPLRGPDVVVAAVVPNGVPAGLAVATALDAPLVGLEVERPEAVDGVPGRSEPVVRVPSGCEGRVVVVADDAVETGTAARLAASAVRAAGASRVVLAVPVCPREAEAAMLGLYDEVVAVVRPLARRALTWHYASFVPLDPVDARTRIGHYAASR